MYLSPDDLSLLFVCLLFLVVDVGRVVVVVLVVMKHKRRGWGVV